MTRQQPGGFTLAELLIGIGIISLLSTVCVFQSVSSFQRTTQRVDSQNQMLAQEAEVGKNLRHITIDRMP